MTLFYICLCVSCVGSFTFKFVVVQIPLSLLYSIVFGVCACVLYWVVRMDQFSIEMKEMEVNDCTKRNSYKDFIAIVEDESLDSRLTHALCILNIEHLFTHYIQKEERETKKQHTANVWICLPDNLATVQNPSLHTRCNRSCSRRSYSYEHWTFL